MTEIKVVPLCKSLPTFSHLIDGTVFLSDGYSHPILKLRDKPFQDDSTGVRFNAIVLETKSRMLCSWDLKVSRVFDTMTLE